MHNNKTVAFVSAVVSSLVTLVVASFFGVSPLHSQTMKSVRPGFLTQQFKVREPLPQSEGPAMEAVNLERLLRYLPSDQQVRFQNWMKLMGINNPTELEFVIWQMQDIIVRVDAVSKKLGIESKSLPPVRD